MIFLALLTEYLNCFENRLYQVSVKKEVLTILEIWFKLKAEFLIFEVQKGSCLITIKSSISNKILESVGDLIVFKKKSNLDMSSLFIVKL